mmetsp:Transcript_4677/g.13242  ORF Transcript_4677/g.13242 Transcript_4677/m.13242 type:complete len:251 (+) Transcript_4677:3492-4244(+)
MAPRRGACTQLQSSAKITENFDHRWELGTSHTMPTPQEAGMHTRQMGVYIWPERGLPVWQAQPEAARTTGLIQRSPSKVNFRGHSFQCPRCFTPSFLPPSMVRLLDGSSCVDRKIIFHQVRIGRQGYRWERTCFSSVGPFSLPRGMRPRSTEKTSQNRTVCPCLSPPVGAEEPLLPMEVTREAWPRNTRVDRGTLRVRNGADAVITGLAPLIALEVAVAAAIGQQQQAVSPDYTSASKSAPTAWNTMQFK